jgi:uncharacterized membrane protein YdjX (TVP38/TMEM64 family)
MRIENRTKRFVKNEEKFVKYEWKHYKAILIVLVVLLTVESYLSGSLESFLRGLGSYGYLGVLFSGFLFTYGITTPFAIASFFILAESMNIWTITILGSLGGLLSEYIIYDFVRKKANKNIKVYRNKKIRLPEIKSKLLKKLSPLIAGFIIATPIPDEFAAVLFGIEKYRLRDFLILTFISKFIGILLIVELGLLF